MELMNQESVSNYDKLCVQWREKFITWDHEAIYQNLELDGCHSDHLDITYFKNPYHIDRKTGIITNLKAPEEKITFDTQMNIYHLFYYSKEKPKNSGDWVPFRQVKRAAPFESAFQKMVLEPFADAFSNQTQKLIEAGTALGFYQLPHGDVSFYVEAFPCIGMKYIFWDGDDEFPAQANILFDQNITDFTHEETVVLLAQAGVDRFLEAL